MRRATLGNWINYATTLAAQVLFARQFGSGSGAAAYTIVFGLMAGLTGVLVSSIQSVVLPRLIDDQHAYRRGPLRLMCLMTVGAAMLSVAALAATTALAATLGSWTHVDEHLLVPLIRIAAVTIFLQFVAGELVALSLARGSRFLPAFAPAFPSLAVSVILLVPAQATVTIIFDAFAIGSVVEVAALALSVRGRFRTVRDDLSRMGLITALTLGQYILLSLLTPLERIVIAHHDTTSVVHFYYAIRTLTSVQSLIVGGLALAGLGTWSALASRGELDTLRSSLLRALLLASAALTGSAAIALLGIHSLVVLVYQHGSFSEGDSAAVATLILLALPGFVAQGMGLVLSTALAATRHNASLIGIGLTTVISYAALLLVVAPIAGARGVAVAYSGVAVIGALLLGLAVSRASLWPSEWRAAVIRPATVLSGTLAAAVIVAWIAGTVSPWYRCGVVVTVFFGLFTLLRPRMGLSWSHAITPAPRGAASQPLPPKPASD